MKKTSLNSLIFSALVALFLFVAPSAFASSSAEEDHGEAKEFNAGDLIMHHIGDAHDWHIMDWDHHPVSVPLPIILYSKEKGLDVFLSSKFEHGHADHNGYRLEHGHIFAVDAAGHVNEEATAGLWDLSLTKNATSLVLSVVFMLLIFLSVAKAYKRNAGKAPKGLQSFIEPIILFVRDDIAKAAIGEKKYAKFMPYLLTIFFFIWINNIMGLIPIFPFGANVTGNIVPPLVLALFTFVITTVNGNKNYWRHIIAMPGIPIPVLIILTPIEIMGVFIKPIVLVIRLFANIMAGHIVLLVFFCLIFIFGASSVLTGSIVAIPAIAFTIFINCLELLVGAIQAYVFTLLSAIYFGMATAESDH